MKSKNPHLGFLLVAYLAAGASAQDLQPGVNFPVASPHFGADNSENIDFGDVDWDGDLDAVVANGGDLGNQQTRLFINQGGAQGGVIGTWVEETFLRFPAMPMSSRDVELVDLDGDEDLDLYISNSTDTGGPQPSRFWINQGGVQGGTVGFFVDETAERWAGLVSGLPLPEGGFVDWSCDCDFADFDNDGDLDLFHSAYGPGFSGTVPSRLFMNDGNGYFSERWPWALQSDTGAPPIITGVPLDIDLVDIDGDLDPDVFFGNETGQPRVFRNDGRGFMTDITQTALLDQGVAVSGFNYEVELGDLDGDADLDAWLLNASVFVDWILKNDGQGRFSRDPAALVGDPQVDEVEVDFGDYDNDGDLDAAVASFSGINFLYKNLTAQGQPGVLTRTGVGGVEPEMTAIGNAGASNDVQFADVDNDGDLDISIVNEQGQQNIYLENTLGVPDTIGPTIGQITSASSLSPNGPWTINASIIDNISYWDSMGAVGNTMFAELTYDFGSSPMTVSMSHMGGQLWRAVIPAGNGLLSYFVRATDAGSNTTASPTETLSVNQGGGLSPYGEGCHGSAWFTPLLSGSGSATQGGVIQLEIHDVLGGASQLVFVGTSPTSLPIEGGPCMLLTSPILLVISLNSPGAGPGNGSLTFPSFVPVTLPSMHVYLQVAVIDPGASNGKFAVSNGLDIDIH